MEVSGQLHIPAAFAREGASDTHWIRGWVGLGASLVMVAEKNPFIAPAGN